jgi:CRISPR/Cas system-associated exonuclease Cas4 (RecB family)
MSRWSYSKVSTYERCPKKKNYKYDEHAVGIATENTAAIRGNALHKDLELHVEKSLLEVPEWMRPHQPHLEKFSSGHKEQKITLDEDWESVPDGDENMICIIDLLHIDEPYGTVIDYKSGKRYPGHSEQIELYCAAALCALPELERLEGRCYYLDEKAGSWSKPMFITREQVASIKARWDSRVLMMEIDTENAPRPGYYCKWCEYRNSGGGPCRFG